METQEAERLSLRITVAPGETLTAAALLAQRSGLAKARIKDAMIKGAVFLIAGKGSRKRLRRATAPLKAGQVLELHYDRRLLEVTPPTARCLYDAGPYSVWEKPAGLLSQGTQYGDHCSLVRQAELHCQGQRPVLPVHRLDREATGLMLLAHSREAAAKLSRMLQENRIAKGYRVVVIGRPEPAEGAIELPLDDKPARTRYRVTGYDPTSDRATVAVTIDTGRLHQIRRHFAAIDHPVLGDPRYGTGNKNQAGLALVAHRLVFRCPFTDRQLAFDLDQPQEPEATS